MKERVISIISEVSAMNRTPREITEEMTLADDLAIDSLGFVRMILDIESTFSIKFDDEYVSMEKMLTVKDVITYVKEKTSERRK